MGDFLEIVRLFGPWVCQFLYTICFIPQIIHNYRCKFGTGISEFFLIGYLNVYIALLYYVFLCNMPLAYKSMGVLQLLATLILIYQRLYYNGRFTNRLWLFYVLNIILGLAVLPLAFKYPISVGLMGGWVMLLVGSVNQLPQIFKIYKEKNTAGFSLFFVVITALAGITEVTLSILLQFPMQTLLSSSRVAIIALIFCFQFWWYRKNNKCAI